MKVKRSQFGFATFLVLVVVALVIVVVGIVVYFQLRPTTQQFQSLPTTAVVTQPTPPTQIGETVNWKTYTNSTLGIQFSHPDNAEVEEDGPFRSDAFGKAVRMFFLLGNTDREEAFETHLTEGLVIDVMQIDNKGKSLYELADKETKMRVLDGERKEFAKIVLDGEEGYKAVFGPNEFTWMSGIKKTLVTSVVFYFKVNGKFYYFSSSYAGVYASAYQRIFDRILSTFKFL